MADLSPEVVRLVRAARVVAFNDEVTPDMIRDLDAASEAFAAVVPWENNPDEH